MKNSNEHENLGNEFLVLRENSTISDAVDLMNINNSMESDSNWKTKELGLSLVLLGLAEVNAIRIQRLSQMVNSLEHSIFNETAMQDLSPLKVIELYKLANDSLKECHSYVKNTMSSVDFDEIELRLKDMSVSNNNDSETDLSMKARMLLKNLASMNLMSENNVKKIPDLENSDE